MGMRWATFGIVACLVAVQLAYAKPAPPGGPDHEDVPYHATVSEVSKAKDGHVIHNRLDFDCEAAEGSRAWPPPKKIDCVLVQQDLQEPSAPPSKEELAKAVAEMTDGDKLKELCQKESTRPPTSQQDEEFRRKVTKACDKKNRADVVASVTDIVREMEETASHTCTMMTFVSRIPFTYVKKGVWVSPPDPLRNCQNVAITRTLRRDGSSWNYTEATVATPSKDPLCSVAESGTTEFTWRQAYTATPLGCRYVEM